MLEAFITNFILMIFSRLDAMLSDRIRRKSFSNTENSNESWVQEFYCKITQFSEENESYLAK